MDYIILSSLAYDQPNNTIYFRDNNIDGVFLKNNNQLYISTKIIKDEILQKYNLNPTKSELNNDKNKTKLNGENDKNLYYSLINRTPVGLYNYDGGCYMNAALQCFYHCKPLTKFFLVDLEESKKATLGPISKGYYKLIKGLGSGNRNAANEFEVAMKELDSIFIGTEGKDSQDVVKLLLSELDEEFLGKDDMNYDINNNINRYDLKSVYKNFLSKNKEKTIIRDIFRFNIKSKKFCKNTCKTYKNEYYNIDSDFLMMFNLRKIYEDINKSSYSSTPEISLEDCLTHFKKAEIINCAHCKTNTLQIVNSICSLPKIFVFILSRGYKNEFKCKINFKEDLDMKYYYDPIDIEKKNENTKYKLICATFAYDWSKKGTGHTVAFCKSYKQNKSYPNMPVYYLFNDRNSYQTTIKEIEGKIPYLLFYEKQE